jgi:hypothetical protein
MGSRFGAGARSQVDGRTWDRNRNVNRNRNVCRNGMSSAGSARSVYCHGETARGRRLATGAVGELGTARSPGTVGRKKHGFRDGFGGRG